MTKAKKLGVTTRAIIQRINRKLAAEDEVLKVARGANLEQQVGRFYIINYRMNAVMHHDVDPEALGRDLGVLKAWEKMID